MSNKGGNEHFENMVLFLVVGGLGLAAVLYVAFLFWPYLVFFFIPIIVGSVVVGGFLRIATAPGEDGQFQYKNLAIAFPILIAATLLVFFAQSGRAYMVDKKSNIIATYLDWPEVNKTFNEYRSSTYRESPFDSLKAKAREPVVYDRQELGWMMFLCLFLGGPAFFWYLARDDKSSMRNASEEIALERTKSIRERVDKKERELDETLARGLKTAQEKVAAAERARAAIAAENQILRAKVEFTTDAPKGSETKKTGGVLDSDIL